MRKAKLMAALLCLGMATAPVSAKEITTNTNPEAYGSVAELEKRCGTGRLSKGWGSGHTKRKKTRERT